MITLFRVAHTFSPDSSRDSVKSSLVANPHNYKNTDRIGSGGFGTVWKCTRSQDGQIFAKKLLDSSSGSDPEILKRFRREVRMLSELDHPNIVKVVAKRLLTPPYFYVMPLYAASLADYVSVLVGDEVRIRKVFTQVLDAVEYAHKQGVIHRDLKPQNVLYNSDDDIVVSDFGLGRQLNSASLRQTGTGFVIGTALYMAPEQGTDAKTATYASDIYSLGRILLELYQSPLTVAPPDYSHIPAPIGVVLRRCFEVDPARRFASVTDLKTAFHSIFDAAALASLADSLQQVVARLAAEQFPEEDDIRKFMTAISHNLPDGDLVLESVMAVNPITFSGMEEYDLEVTKQILFRFVEVAESQSWPFAFTDKIADVVEGIFSGINDYEIKSQLILCLIKIGISHNRYKVMQTAGKLLVEPKEPGEAMPLREKLLPLVDELYHMSPYVKVNRLDPQIRAIFAQHRTDD